MAEYGKKRRAEDQLSPYSKEIPESSQIERKEEHSQQPTKQVARLAKNKEINREAVKGIFSSMPSVKALSKDDKVVMSGINSSFLKAVKLVLSKDTSKDLTYLFSQYRRFVNSVHDNLKKQK